MNISRTALLLAAAATLLPAQTRRLNTTQFIVMGEGMAAGQEDFGLRLEFQKLSFPAQVAKQMGAFMPLPLIQGPGLVILPGTTPQPAILPTTRQTTVRDGFPPSLFVFNLSVPGMKLADAVSRRPAEPLIRTNDPQQTIINLILGYPQLITGRARPTWTQLEYAEKMRPTLTLVNLGYFEAADGAATGDITRIPDAATFRTNINTVLSRLRATFTETIVSTIPDPFDTAYFTPYESATRLVGAPPAVLASLYGLRAGDYLTPPGLMAIGNQLLTRKTGALPANAIVRAAAVTTIRARVQALNAEITASAQANNAILYDMAALFRRVRTDGLIAGTRVLTADYLGGFYSMNGFYPGTTGHALIANDILALINRTYGRNFPIINLATASAGDPAVRLIPTFRGDRAQATQENQQ